MSNAYLVETLGQAIGERDRRIAALEAEAAEWRRRAERLAEAVAGFVAMEPWFANPLIEVDMDYIRRQLIPILAAEVRAYREAAQAAGEGTT